MIRLRSTRSPSNSTVGMPGCGPEGMLHLWKLFRSKNSLPCPVRRSVPHTILLFSFFTPERYDVYTPTRNIVFHDYGAQPNGHGDDEWFKRQRDGERKDALKRVKTIVQLFGGDPTVTAQANLGIYGLGKRRTIQQLMEFEKMKDVDQGVGNKGKVLDCVGHEWVPYDTTISPVENLFDKPDNLDPQPEYPKRTNLIFYQQPDKVAPKIHFSINEEGKAEVNQAEHQLLRPGADAAAGVGGDVDFDQQPQLPSFSLLFVMWAFGLMIWCVMFVMNSEVIAGAKKKVKKKKKQAMAKDM